MKKKYVYMIITFVLFILLIIGVVVFVRYSEKNAFVDKLSSTVWTLIRDEYTSTEAVKFEGEPIDHSNIMIKKDSCRFCLLSEIDKTGKRDETCVEYKSSINLKKNQLIVYTDNKKIVYTYSFSSDNQLILTYGDHRFSLIYYYGAAKG